MTHEECYRKYLPLKDAVELLSGKWKIPIILILLSGNKRYKELNELIAGISSKVLSTELQDLEQNLLICKISDPQLNVVKYSLTEHGKSLEPLIDVILKWGQSHRKLILSA